MKHRKYITTLSLIVALTGLSPVMADDAVRTLRSVSVKSSGTKYTLAGSHQTNGPKSFKGDLMDGVEAQRHKRELTTAEMDSISAGGVIQILVGGLIVNAIYDCLKSCGSLIPENMTDQEILQSMGF